MFRARMKIHEVAEPVAKDDGLGFSYTDYSEPQDVLMYVTSPTASSFNQNEFYTSRFDAVGFTFANVPKGSLIDGRWKVDSIDSIRGCELVLGLVAFGDDEHGGQ